MASSSNSSNLKSFKYDVYLSFRGADTRKTFVDHLYSALRWKGIHTYMDESLQHGQRICDEVFRSIEDSKFIIIIFSKNYASSAWCLDELVKIMECHDTTDRTVCPLFYDVEPSEVRWQSGAVGDAFARNEKDEAAGKWRRALQEATDLAGWTLSNMHEEEAITQIVEYISLELRSIHLSNTENIIGMEPRIPEVLPSLETAFNNLLTLESNIPLMASSSIPSNRKIFKYDVYLSFRGEDTRTTFAEHLDQAFKKKRIVVYMEKMTKKGRNIFNEITRARQDSKFFIIIFSRNYASSSWCLDELVKIMEYHNTNEQIACPLFYDVEPYEVRRQSGAVGEAFARHENKEAAGKWRQALKEAANLVGWDLRKMANGHEAEAISQIVEEISLKLPSIHVSNDEKKIPLEAIKECTQDFDKKNIIGSGGYGNVYKGILTWADHVSKLVAVKRVYVGGDQGNKEFQTEVTMLSQYQHKNIITLIGSCDDNEELILVYEYASHGSLDMYLHDGGLSWAQLLNICIGVASALNYLHNGVAEKHRIIHRDIKSSNVLLDKNLNAKLSDFGLARIGLVNQQNTCVITRAAGTQGYCDPQFVKTGLLTKESDVYSFGVVLFEVLCGRLACVCDYNDERVFLHHLARTRYRSGDLEGIIDPRIRKDIKERTLNKFSDIAYRCIQKTRKERPEIAEVVIQLKEAMKIQLEDEDDGGN